jgi:hypothetical protein
VSRRIERFHITYTSTDFVGKGICKIRARFQELRARSEAGEKETLGRLTSLGT